MTTGRLSDSITGLIIWSLIIIIYAIYTPGLNGAFYYDDYFSLQALPSIQDIESALYYVSSGETGPLGRPISLASFLIHTADWPNNPEPIFRVNIFIHLINGLLLIWLILKTLVIANIGPSPQRPWIALSAIGLWMALPILASTSLIAIQRMTSLSATFVISGLLLYMIGVGHENRHPHRAWVLQLIAICGGTILATLAKENGALLPVFILVLELSLLRNLNRTRAHQPGRLILLFIPLLFILAFLFKTILYAKVDNFREFSIYERLITQPIILLDYLRLAFFPQTFLFSPFHDNYQHSTSLFSPFSTFIAIVIWCGLLVTAIWVRQKWPILTFAVFWFLGGHLLESTVLPLELYFEHRNYLPLVGPCLAISCLVWYLGTRGYRTAPVFFVVYLGLIMFSLYQTTSLWGDRLLAAEIWHQQNPQSSRATKNLAVIYTNELEDIPSAIKILDETTNGCLKCLELSFEALMLACTQEAPEKVMERLNKIFERIDQVRAKVAPVGSLTKIHNLRRKGYCAFLSDDTLIEINRALLNNPFFSARQGRGPAVGLHYNLYELYRDQGKEKAAFDELYAAWKADPGINIAQIIVNELIKRTFFDKAAEFTEKIPYAAPLNPLKRWWWIKISRDLEGKTSKARLAYRS